ncbi:MAG: P-loop NTPase fold protein [Paracoccus sp. (in: a-proteobacteria)]
MTAIKLFPPQEVVDLYQQGFVSTDLLYRNQVGERLSELLERVEDPTVTALDGPWGSGKSHFLKRRVGAHQLENRGRAATVYFDAFANDFLNDPLIGLTGAIAERLPDAKPNALKAVKGAAAKLVRSILRMTAAAVTAGATEITGPAPDAMIANGGKEADKAIDVFWRRAEGRKAAMQQFQKALEQLTAPSASDQDDTKPLIVVIDELDRCRPDYALAVLKTIRHFFSVPHAHFVLGVNLDALEHMVRARYGAGRGCRRLSEAVYFLVDAASQDLAGRGKLLSAGSVFLPRRQDHAH